MWLPGWGCIFEDKQRKMTSKEKKELTENIRLALTGEDYDDGLGLIKLTSEYRAELLLEAMDKLIQFSIKQE